LLFVDRGRPITGGLVDRALTKVAHTARIGHVTAHQPRHTLATQAINRGMSLDAIAALLGHKTLAMTMVHARIADRTVADEYSKVSEKVEALYNPPACRRRGIRDAPAARRPRTCPDRGQQPARRPARCALTRPKAVFFRLASPIALAFLTDYPTPKPPPASARHAWRASADATATAAASQPWHCSPDCTRRRPLRSASRRPRWRC
jgi:hypothetical protein